MLRANTGLRWVWPYTVACFILAGSTGALYRFGVLDGLPAGLNLTNVRHAHSHLMYFGWVTPLLMALIADWVSAVTGRANSAGFRRVIGATIVLALLAYLPFLGYGYSLADVGGAEMPPGVIAATLNILAWYAFGVVYVRATRGAPRSRPLRLWDAALIFQVVASCGAWGRAVLVGLHVDDPFWSSAMVDLFLDLFSDGWFILAVLGLAYASFPEISGKLSRWSDRLVIVGLLPTFLLAIPPSEVPSDLRAIASVGGFLVGLGLLGHVWSLWPAAGKSRAWRVPLIFLAVKAVAELGLTITPLAAWGWDAGLRIPYLHVLFLGFVTLGLAAAVQDAWNVDLRGLGRWLTAAILLLLATLIPLTTLWPRALAGRWTLEAAALGALGPVAVAIGLLVVSIHHRGMTETAVIAGGGTTSY